MTGHSGGGALRETAWLATGMLLASIAMGCAAAAPLDGARRMPLAEHWRLLLSWLIWLGGSALVVHGCLKAGAAQGSFGRTLAHGLLSVLGGLLLLTGFQVMQDGPGCAWTTTASDRGHHAAQGVSGALRCPVAWFRGDQPTCFVILAA